MRKISVLGFLMFAAACTNDGPSSVTSPASPANVGGITTQAQHGGAHPGTGIQGGQHGGGFQIAATCTPALSETEGNLFPGGPAEFAVTSGSGSVTIDASNSGTGLQQLTVISATNAIVTIPAFTPGTKDPVVVTFTVIDPGQAVVFNLRAASTFHADNIRASCAAACTPTILETEGDLFPSGTVSFDVSSGPGSVTVDHVNTGTGLRSLTVVSATNAIVSIPPFVPGTFNPVVVTFTAVNPSLPVEFTLRAASTFHAVFIRARCP